MPISRRTMLGAGAALSATLMARAFATGESGALTTGGVVERIKGKVGIPWNADTVDRIVAGSAEVRVRGIATTMMATQDVLLRAAAAGCNLVIAHEPTFYSHTDELAPFGDDPTLRAKRDFIAAHDMAVFRFHDHWHLMSPDGIAAGMVRELGWERNADATHPGEFVFPETTLDEFAKTLAQRLDARSMRILGDPALPIRRVIARWGYASLLPDLDTFAARPGIDLIIVGETREWELVEYVEDQIATGNKKALIVLNHVVSEQGGMKHCAEWLKGFISEVPVRFIATREPFRQLRQQETATP
ncbi:MAG TPA: Nif3-like dinuclear metal center hexameric protein [Pseudoxanthomonas sp.]